MIGNVFSAFITERRSFDVMVHSVNKDRLSDSESDTFPPRSGTTLSRKNFIFALSAPKLSSFDSKEVYAGMVDELTALVGIASIAGK